MGKFSDLLALSVNTLYLENGSRYGQSYN